ncbi:AraC family transcriptional regulator [Paenibacillus koleovorans]|uniref:AraC family transcriptional regulator n=1 Tax=Paenibacillus koleovorans TaxID=121608 RepID=UPI0013E30BC1|nr:AraC family transcriptional regulator [Paenibacillus koleovorans]
MSFDAIMVLVEGIKTYNWKESQHRLNQYAARPRTGLGALYEVMYWGATPIHRTNMPHKHSFCEICYVLGGEGEYWDGGVLFPLRPGVLFCSRPGQQHQIVNDPGMQLLYVAFELDEERSSESAKESYKQLAETESIWVEDGDELPTALLWRALLVPDLQQQQQPLKPAGGGGAMSLPEAMLPDAAGLLLQSFERLFLSREAGAERESAVDGKRRGGRQGATAASALLLKQAKRFIADNMADDDLSLRQVAAHLNISQRHLSRLFSAGGVRESFTDYVRLQRVRRAAELLRQSDLSIKAIADATGFGSVHYFTRTFGELMHESPARFRESGR